MATKIGGRATVFINGQQVPVRADITITVANKSRTTVIGVDAVHGVTELPAAAAIEMTLSDLPEVDVMALQDLTDANISVTMDSGMQYVLRNAAQVTPIEINQQEGSYTIRFEGATMTRSARAST